MTFDEFMNLEVGDGVEFDGCTGSVTDITDVLKGSVLRENGIAFRNEKTYRELTIKCYIPSCNGFRYYYPKIYTDYPDCIHNKMILSSIKILRLF